MFAQELGGCCFGAAAGGPWLVAQFPAPLKLGPSYEGARAQSPASLELGPSHEAARAQSPAPLKLGLCFEAART